MTTQSYSTNVFCSRDVLPRARREYPPSVRVSQFIVPDETAPGGFSSPSARDDAWRETQKRVAAAILAEKPSDPPAKPDMSAVNFSPAARAFRNEFKLPGQGAATTSPSPEKKPRRVGLSDAAAAFAAEFKLPGK